MLSTIRHSTARRLNRQTLATIIVVQAGRSSS
jgi:hypothetical protein